MPIARTLTDPTYNSALTGLVSRLAATHGSSWGQITPNGFDRKVFFNRASFTHQTDFDSIQLGQRVTFVEESDHMNGTRAVDVFPSDAKPYTDFSRLSGR